MFYMENLHILIIKTFNKIFMKNFKESSNKIWFSELEKLQPRFKDRLENIT